MAEASPIVDAFLRKVRSELRTSSIDKSNYYNFDFESCKAKKSGGRIEWEEIGKPRAMSVDIDFMYYSTDD